MSSIINTFEEYNRLTDEQKELHNFELMQRIYSKTNETCEHAKETNGKVAELFLWKNLLLGGLIVVSAIVVPLFLNLLKLHI